MELTRLKRVVEDLVMYAIKRQLPDKGSFVRQSFLPTLQIATTEEKPSALVEQKAVEQKKRDIYYQLDEYIKSKERKVSKATICVYKNVKGLCRIYNHRLWE